MKGRVVIDAATSLFENSATMPLEWQSMGTDRTDRGMNEAMKPRALAAATLLALGLVAPLATEAATIVVTSSADPGNANTCTLRQAIVTMNTGALNGTCVNSGAFGSNDTINFGSGLFAGSSATVTLADQPNNYLSITDNNGLAIDAGAGRNLTVERPAGAQNRFRVLDAELNGGSLQLSGLTVQNGYAYNDRPFDKYSLKGNNAMGGGVFLGRGAFTLDRCTIRNNSVLSTDIAVPGPGGGVAVVAGLLTMNSSVVSGNSALGALGTGGGVYLQHAALNVLASTISGNTSGSTHIGGAALTAGIGNRLAYAFRPNALSIIDSTISGNTSIAAIDGGSAISAVLLSSVSILNSTLACNSGPSFSAIPAVYVSGSQGTSVISTIFANTSNSRCATNTIEEWGSGAASATIGGDHNLVVSSSAISGSVPFPADTVFGDPLLGPLQNNGGFAPTHALGAGSPALDEGSNPSGSSFDERGSPFGRWVGSNPDIGAFEDQTSHLCGTAEGHSFASLSASTPNLCNSGAYLQGGPFGSGPWSWFCAANANPANNEFCGAQVLATAALLIENASSVIVNSAVFGQPLHLKAVVSGGASTPTGTATFADTTDGGFVPVCVNLALSGGGVVCDTTSAPIGVGARRVKVIYNGDGTYGTATSPIGSVNITQAASTATVSGQTPNPVAAGTSFTVVAQVAPNVPSVATPEGVVQIADQTDGISCAYDLSAATPGCALTPASVGTHNLLVTYLGNANMAGSSAPTTETVGLPPVTLTVDDAVQFAHYGQTLRYQITLKNTAAGPASNIAISGTPTANFSGATLSWQCTPGTAASCSSGSGTTFADTVALPAGATLTWMLNAAVPADASGDTIGFSVSVGATKASDADTLVIFRDGFGP
jgi:uncharacterized repeat protein (TIGR01451 family)